MEPVNQGAACRYENVIFEASGSKMVAETKKRGYSKQCNPLILLVGGTGFEPVTSTV